MDAVIGGVRVHWRERGRGPAVLFIHGFPFHGGLWEEPLERLPDRWRLLAPDLRGFGRSELDQPGGPLTMDRFADDLAAFLDDRGVERAAVCGLSMGGYIALWRRHASRVRALVLCDTRPTADTESARRGRVELALRVQREGARAAADAMLPNMLARRTHEQRPEVVERVRRMIEENPAATLVRTLEGLAQRPDSTDLLPTITVPTLVLVGAEDAVTPPADAERIAERIPDARLRVIEDAGHLPSIENPAAFDRELTLFLEATAAH